MNKNRLKLLDELMQKQVDSNMIVGGSLCIIKDGKHIYRNNFGMSDEKNERKVQNDTIFRMYSMTKPVTACATMILYERGLIDLYDSASWYLDGFKNQQVITENGLVGVNRDVRIIDLLNMTSGVVYPDSSNEAGKQMEVLFNKFYDGVFNGKPTSTIDLCNMIGKQPLLFQPGERWCYGLSADILGAIVEVVSRKKYSEFLYDEIFQPLEMNDTGFFVPEEKQDRFAEIYLRNSETNKLEPCGWQHLGLIYHYKKPPEFESGGAGLVSTMDDYAKFAQMLLNGGKLGNTRILSTRTIGFMTKNHLSDKQKTSFDWESCRGYGYGNLMRILTDKNTAGSIAGLNEYGWDGWTGNYFCNDPENNITFLYMIQTCGGNGPRPLNQLKQILYSSLD